MPPPEDAGIWIPPQGGQVGIGVSTGCRGQLRTGWYAWDLLRARDRVVLNAEHMAQFPQLRAHIPDARLWSALGTWEEEAASYLSACHEFVLRIVEEVEKRTGTKLLTEDQWPQEGVFWAYAAQMYQHWVLVAEFPEGTGLRENAYTRRLEASRVSSQGMVEMLWCGDRGIASHRDLNELEKWRLLHPELLQDDRFAESGRALVAKFEALEERGKPVVEVLRVEAERGVFDGGRCTQCP